VRSRPFILVFVFHLLISLAFSAEGPPTTTKTKVNKGRNDINMKDNIIIEAGGKTFTATLLDNPATIKFKAMLPLTVRMEELNGNEKYFRLSSDLPVDASNPGTIKSGDLMLWGSNTLVLFYETFPTSYSYTKLGRITNPQGLATAVGKGSVNVTFASE